ncbi:MAG: hypothetical protein ACRDKV_01305 [Solirubrobacterales bacterium]
MSIEGTSTVVAEGAVEVESPPAATNGLSGFADRVLLRLAGAVEAFPTRLLALLTAVVIVGFGVLGGLEFFTSAQLGFFDVESEGTVPTAFSGVLLLAAAFLALAVARMADLTPAGRLAVWLIAAFFVFMGVDDVFSIHERVGTALGMRWQIPMLPVVAVAAFFWLRVLRAMSVDRLASKLWIAGAAVWVGSQVFEGLQSAFVPGWEAGTYGSLHMHGALALIEETGEMAGSALFLFALLVFLRSQIAVRGWTPALSGHHTGT